MAPGDIRAIRVENRCSVRNKLQARPPSATTNTPATRLTVVNVARLRARYRAILREEVSGTVIDPRDVDEELRHLRQAMAK